MKKYMMTAAIAAFISATPVYAASMPPSDAQAPASTATMIAPDGAAPSDTMPAGATAMQPAPAVAVSALSEKTAAFITKASIGGQFEILSSKVAIDRAVSLNVKEFAKNMVDDHTKAGDELKSAVTAAGFDQALVTDKLDNIHESKLTSLEKEEPKKFDKEYMDEQKEAHAKTVSLFRDYAANGDVKELKNFAAKTLPVLEMHDKRAEEIESNLK